MYIPEATLSPLSFVRSQVTDVLLVVNVFAQRPDTVKILTVVLTVSWSKDICRTLCRSDRHGFGYTRTPDRSAGTSVTEAVAVPKELVALSKAWTSTR